MPSITPCNTDTLAIYIPTVDNPWDLKKVKHLYRRLGYGIHQNQFNTALSQTPENLIDTILSEATTASPIPAPEWAYWSYSNYNPATFDDQNQTNKEELYNLVSKYVLNHGLRGRLIFFWMNHFVTQQEVYNCSSYMFQYFDILYTYSLGNFKEFTRTIGLTPAMLHYLNGFDNTSEEPNENYARELFELFTLGENNGYTQRDIEEASRALTGYNSESDYCGDVIFNQYNSFDASDKTIFGKTGAYDYDGLIDLLFEEKGALIADYICTKLYTYFVSPIVNTFIISELAVTFLATGFEIEPVLKRLFKSEHFFNAENAGLLIKSPFDLTHQYLTETGFIYDDELINLANYINSVLGQEMFQPVDVAGWQRNHDWINSSTMTGRWIMMEWIVYAAWNLDKEQLRKFAKEVSGNSSDVNIVTKSIIDHFMARPLASPSDYTIATTILKWEYPENYYTTDGVWNLDFEAVPWQITLLLLHIIKMPDFQLK